MNNSIHLTTERDEMRTYSILILAISISMFLVSNSVKAADSDVIEVVATGIGKDSDAALKNALRAAVEQAVGTLVDSETIVDNDEIMNDQILSYSAGFVQSHRVIGEPLTRDGLVTIKIKATVQRTELSKKLEAASIRIIDIDGESLFGEAITKMDQAKKSADILKKAFEGYPANVLEISGPNKDNPPAYDEKTKKLALKINISVNREKYREFIRRITPILHKVSSEHRRVSIDSRITQGGHQGAPHDNGLGFDDTFRKWLYWENSQDVLILLCTQINDARTNSVWESFIIPEEAFNAITLQATSFIVEIVDSNDELISSAMNSHAYPTLLHNGSKKRFIFPLLANAKDSHLFNGFIYPGTTEYTYNLIFDVSSDEIKRMRNVICRIE